MSGRPRTTSFAEGGKPGQNAPFGGMRTISEYEFFGSAMLVRPSKMAVDQSSASQDTGILRLFLTSFTSFRTITLFITPL